MSLLTHLRNFGFIVKDFHEINPRLVQEKAFSMILDLSKIVMKIMASQIREYEVSLLQQEIISYLNDRKIMFEEFPRFMSSPKPKTHFVSHYPEAIILYGPARNFWTARHESKHRVGKSLAVSGKNFINISKTISERQQMRLASVYYNGIINSRSVIINSQVRRKTDLSQKEKNSPIFKEILEFCDEKTLILKEIIFKNQKYETEDVVILENGVQILKIGLIQAIIFKDDDVYFLVYRYTAIRTVLGFYRTTEFDNNLFFIRANQLADSKPLIMHGVVLKFEFCLHHYLSIKCSDIDIINHKI